MSKLAEKKITNTYKQCGIAAGNGYTHITYRSRKKFPKGYTYIHHLTL